MIKSILVVEDSEADQFFNEITIKGYSDEIKIHQAFDGEEALELLNSGIQPDVILLDINMPRMDGHSFLESYYGDNRVDIPVVTMLTSSDQEQDKEKVAKYSSVKDYFLKPLTHDHMARLEKILGSSD